MYSRLRKAVGDVNVIVPTYPDKLMRDVQMNSGTGTVAFGSDLRGWGFNIERFATICATNMDMDMDKMMPRLRGYSFFNATNNIWTNVQQPEGVLGRFPRALCFASSSWEPVTS